MCKNGASINKSKMKLLKRSKWKINKNRKAKEMRKIANTPAINQRRKYHSSLKINSWSLWQHNSTLRLICRMIHWFKLSRILASQVSEKAHCKEQAHPLTNLVRMKISQHHNLMCNSIHRKRPRFSKLWSIKTWSKMLP